MKLLTLKFVTRGNNGWESPTLEFGKRTTSLFAPNGSGKTPVIQAIAFSLGFQTSFREDIKSQCAAIELTFEHNSSIYSSRREIGSGNDFHISIESNGQVKDFYNESDFSTAVYQTFGLNEPLLISTNRQPTKPYISTILPIFYVKQDGGYLDAYKASSNFIQDQFVEMMRFVFGLAPKRSYTAQKDLIDAKDELSLLQERIVGQRKIVQDFATRADDSAEAKQSIESRAILLESQLDQLRHSIDTTDLAGNALIELHKSKEGQLKKAKTQYYDIKNRVAGIESIRAEIEGEILTLSLNEQSKRAFEDFGDFCSRPDCGVFQTSSETYAKNLMYLKDQIKDLESNATRAEIQIEFLHAHITELEKDRSDLQVKINLLPSMSGTQQLVTSVQDVTIELIEIGQKRAEIEALSASRNKYFKLELERDKVQDRIATLNNNTRGEIEFSDLRLRIRESLVYWMESLHTINVSKDIQIDHNFKFKFGNEPLEVITGSTRSRLVLAIHAAIFEDYLKNPTNPFRFIILDTPKQHELNGADLANYLHKLQGVCSEYNGQIIISSTEYRHPIGDDDKEWLPQYPSQEQPMYLGRPGSPLIDY